MDQARRIVVGVTGASGAAYARRVIQLLVAAGVETHVVVSPAGQRLFHDELGMEGVDVEGLLGGCELAPGRVVFHPYRDIGAGIASGSFRHEGMVVVPCSSNTLSAVATGSAGNLLHRAASVTLKERRPLVLVHREMPVSMVDIRNMGLAAEAGAVICPASPGFYMMPTRIEDLVDFVAARVLDQVGIEHGLAMSWGETSPTEQPCE